jgi:isocitrate dehydrogenase
VVARLGQRPETLKAVAYAAAAEPPKPVQLAPQVPSQLVGVDVYVEWPSADPNTLAAVAEKAGGDGLNLQMIDNRGVKVWPGGLSETFCTDGFRCRFMSQGEANHGQILKLLERVLEQGLDIAKTEYLRNYEGVAGFTLAQGQ